MRLITALLVAIFYFFLPIVKAQVEQPLRVEIEVESEKEDNAVIPAGENGLVMYTLTNERVKERNKFKWLFSGYSPDFKETWRSAYIINESYSIRERYYSDGFLYLLFGRYNREDVVTAIVDVKTGMIKSIPGKLPKKFVVQSFRVYNGEAYISGSLRKSPSLIFADLNRGSYTNLPMKFEGVANFESIDYDTLSRKVNIVYTVNRRNVKYVVIRSFKRTEMVGDLAIKPEGNDNLLSGKITTISENEKVIIGTYGVRGNSGSSGLYFARLLNDSQFIINYYNFTDFGRFFDFLSKKEKEKIQRKKEKKEAKGKELNLEYQLLVHDLIQKDGEYLMVAEAYYPTYRTEPYTYTTVINGVPIIQTRYITVFDGWLYTHAIIAGFDKEGRLMWDNSIEMGDFKTFNLEPRVSISTANDEIVLTYGTFEEIKTKVIRGQEVVDAKDELAIKTGYDDDIVRRGVLSNVTYWYDKYFIVWGFQRIKNAGDGSMRGRRTVFYFNKVAFR